MVEAVRFGCMHCGGVVLAFPTQIGGSTECPQCKEHTPVPAPQDGGSVGVAIKPAGSGVAPKPIPGAAPKQPAAPPARAAAPKPAPAAPAKLAAPAKGGKPLGPRQFRFPCPACNAPVTADRLNAGLMMLCPECKANFDVPEPAPA
jgi:phage FluMu protein Com